MVANRFLPALGSAAFFSVAATAAALQGAPLWKLTSRRSVSVTEVLPAPMVQAEAMLGTASPSAVYSMSESYKLLISGKFWLENCAGSKLTMSARMATRRRPPLRAWACAPSGVTSGAAPSASEAARTERRSTSLFIGVLLRGGS